MNEDYYDYYGEDFLCRKEHFMLDPEDYNPDDCYGEDDGQPTEYDEWQDYMGGDDWDHGQFDEYNDW